MKVTHLKRILEHNSNKNIINTRLERLAQVGVMMAYNTYLTISHLYVI